jgi:hypothetical protein
MRHSGHALVVLSIVLAAVIALGPGADARGFTEGDAARWSWLGADGGTYWYVPEAYLPAVEWDPDAPSASTFVSDQTVWHIERYDRGYFFGPAVVKIEGRPRFCQYLIGSVTPEGQVHIAFNAVRAIPIGSPSITTGTGHMAQQSGQWTFGMQMASGSSSTQVAHWAFMYQCRSDQPCWTQLPGLGQSIPDLLAECGAR